MKLNKNKIIVSALALVIGTSLAGSVTGTLAWYQYSTRANVSFIGQSSGISGNLQMRFASESNDNTAWRTRITWQEMAAELVANNHNYAKNIVPMTYGQMSRDEALPVKGYVQPKYLEPTMANWYEADEQNYAQFELQLRYNERDGKEEGQQGQEKDEKNIERKVYLSKLLIQQDAFNGTKSDLSNAIRVHVSSSYKEMDRTDAQNPVLGQAQFKNKLISKNGGATLTEGKLDLDGDGKNDQDYPEGDEFGFDYQRNDQDEIILDNDGKPVSRNTLSDIVYGEGAQISYAAKSTYEQADKENKYLPYGKEDIAANYEEAAIYPALAGSQGNKLTDLEFDHDGDNGDGENSTTAPLDKFIGQTMESDTEFLTVKVTIWVEGWQQFQSGVDNQNNPVYSAIWDEVKYVDSAFNVGIQFAVEDLAF